MRKPFFFFLVFLVAGACTQIGISDNGSADSADGGGACGDAGSPPSSILCIGLYADLQSKTLAPGVQPYAPAAPLWSDGAAKERWILLPEGQKIDVHNPNEWVFPIGTKLFKQFSYHGKRVETRLFQKSGPNYWVHATYKWNDDDSEAVQSFGESISFPDEDGGAVTPWVIPAPEDCDSCHRGRTNRILGFEQVNLGLPGATGLTLANLVNKDMLSAPLAQTALKIGNDATGLDAPALAWLHTNCGLTCHNTNENALAYGAKMVLKLDPAWLDGSPPSATWDPIKTTIGVLAVSGDLAGTPRIDPGDPNGSAIIQLITERGENQDQMPPAPLSRLVDTADVANVVAWIQHLAAPPAPDGGTEPDGGADAGETDAGDAGETDAGETDAGDAGDGG